MSSQHEGWIMTGHAARPEYHISKARMETLIDGIFAIAMTLLVLGINPPRPQAAVADAVLPGMIEGLVPQVFLFIISFLVLAIFWLGHHRQFHYVHSIDPPLLWINMLILIAIIFVPFSTDVAGDYPAVTDAVFLFHANIFVVGVLFAYQWRHIYRHEHLCEPVPDHAVRQAWHLRSVLVPALAALGGLVCIAAPLPSLLVYILFPAGTFVLRYVPSL